MTYNEENISYIERFKEPSRLHPIAILLNLFRVIKETIFGLGIGLIITLKESVVFFLAFLAVFLLLLVITSILSWFRFTYRIEDDELRVEQGIFIHKKRFISLHRIHKIDISANIIHRLFNLAHVQIDTASSGDGAEVSLIAIDKKTAKQLQRALTSVEITTEEEQVQQHGQAKEISWQRLFIAGLTSGSIGVIFLALLAVFSQFEEFVPDRMYNSAYVWLVSLGLVFIIGLLIVMLIFLWVLGILGTMLKYGKFTIQKREKELIIERGLIETKQLTIPFDRIQAVGIQQNLIRQPLKYVRIFAVVAGGSFDKMEPFPVLFPLLKEEEVAPFLREFLPEFTPTKQELIPIAKRGRPFYLWNAAIFFILLVIPVAYFFPSFLWLVLLLVIISLLFGWLQHKDGGYYIDGKQITLRYRRFEKVTIVTYHHRIQSLKKKQHMIQAMFDLSSIQFSLLGLGGLGTHYTLHHLRDEDAIEVADWYSYRKSPNANKGENELQRNQLNVEGKEDVTTAWDNENND